MKRDGWNMVKNVINNKWRKSISWGCWTTVCTSEHMALNRHHACRKQNPTEIRAGSKKGPRGSLVYAKECWLRSRKLLDTIRHSYVRESSKLFNLPFSRDLRGIKKEVIGCSLLKQVWQSSDIRCVRQSGSPSWYFFVQIQPGNTISQKFNSPVTDGPTDKRMDRQTHPLIEMRDCI